MILACLDICPVLMMATTRIIRPEPLPSSWQSRPIQQAVVTSGMRPDLNPSHMLWLATDWSWIISANPRMWERTISNSRLSERPVVRQSAFDHYKVCPGNQRVSCTGNWKTFRTQEIMISGDVHPKYSKIAANINVAKCSGPFWMILVRFSLWYFEFEMRQFVWQAWHLIIG